jgi:hypothetical protein
MRRHLFLSFTVFFIAIPLAISRCSSEFEKYLSSDKQFMSNSRFYLDTTASGANVTGNISNFPVLLRITDQSILNSVHPGAPDIRFFNSDGTVLSYEVERWDTAAGSAEVWVLFPLIMGNSRSGAITMGYNDAEDGSIPDDQKPNDVFDTLNGFVGVWHMTGAANSTRNNLDAIKRGATPPADAAGIVGSAMSFDGSTGSLDIPNDPSLDLGGTFSVSAWVRWEGSSNPVWTRIVSRKYHYYDSDGWELVSYNTDMGFQLNGHNINASNLFQYNETNAVSSWVSHNWYHIFTLWNGIEGKGYLYVNGQLINSGLTGIILDNDLDMMIGKAVDATPAPSQYWNGLIDEVRVSGVLRSPDWIRLCYENQRADQTLVKFE